MARGVASPSPALPKVSFTKVADDASTQPAGVNDQQARSFGYNDFSTFQRPEPYIRYIEPLDSDLAVQVEYDMDEQDQEWLDAVNTERRNDQLNKVSYETFEIIMDRLEKEWFDLTKNIPKPDMALPSEDSTCAICDDAEGENSNAIVFCDGCNLAVHQDCYGVPYIPEGQWLCRKCTVSPEVPVSCMLCPNEGGAFKQTVNGEWVHLLCAIWVPETRVANEVLMEPITGVERINKQRWKLKCSLCGIKEGACIQCSKTSCFLAFHTTCARREKLLMPMKAAHGTEPATLACYCEKHLPKEQLEAHEAAVAELARSNDPNASFSSTNSPNSHSHLTSPHTPRSSKKARAYAKTYKLGPPMVPAIIVRHIMEYIGKVSVRKKLDFVQLVCRYWSLKREARRGAPLLKRLHLEPWTASSVSKTQTDEEKAMKLEYLKRLRKDLEAVRMLAELTRKREAQKLKQAQIIQDVFSTALFPHAPQMRIAFETVMTHDRHDFFKNPVSKNDVPDYFDIIEKPMCWKVIDGKLDRNEYWNLHDFKNDIYLVLNNATRYNKRDTPIHKAALRIKAQAERILSELEQLPRRPPSETQPADNAEADVDEAGLSTTSSRPHSAFTQTVIGDLEPPLAALSLFTSDGTAAITSDPSFRLLLSSDPLTSLFSFELEKLKPPPTPSPPPQRTSSSSSKSKSRSRRAKAGEKPKRDRAAERERRLAYLALDKAPGFRAPAPARTRRAKRALEAFEREAGAAGDEEDEREGKEAGEGECEGEDAHDEENARDQASEDVDRADGEVEVEADTSRDSAAGVSETESTPAEGSNNANIGSRENSPLPKRSRTRTKRPPHVLPGHTTVPPVVDDIDNQRSFKMFDGGWILPPGQRRGGRAPIERREEVPRKKQRTERQHSALSIYSTPAAENQTLHLNEGEEAVDEIVAAPEGEGDKSLEAEVDIKEEHENDVHLSEAQNAQPLAQTSDDQPQPQSSMDTDPSSSSLPAEPSSSQSQTRSRSKRERPMTVIIEKLDTPATRRAENMERKRKRQEEKLRMQKEGQSRREEGGEESLAVAGTSGMASSSATAGDASGSRPSSDGVLPAQGETVASMDVDESELSSLSSIDGESERSKENDNDEPAMAVGEDGEEKIGSDAGSEARSKRSRTKSRSQRSNRKGSRAQERSSPRSDSRPQTVLASAVRKLSTPASSRFGPEDRSESVAGGGTAEIKLKKGQMLEGGTLVWARVDSYPWWPAVIYEDDDLEVPRAVLKQRERAARPVAASGSGSADADPVLHLVRFWDGRRQWQWLGLDRLRLLGEDKNFDGAMLSGTAKGQRFRNTRVREQCRTAWRAAMSEMETGEGTEDGGAENDNDNETEDQTGKKNSEGTADGDVDGSGLTPVALKRKGSVGSDGGGGGGEEGVGGEGGGGETGKRSQSRSTSRQASGSGQDPSASKNAASSTEITAPAKDSQSNDHHDMDVDRDTSTAVPMEVLDAETNSKATAAVENETETEAQVETGTEGETEMEMVMQLGAEVDTESALTETEL